MATFQVISWYFRKFHFSASGCPKVFKIVFVFLTKDWPKNIFTEPNSKFSVSSIWPCDLGWSWPEMCSPKALDGTPTLRYPRHDPRRFIDCDPVIWPYGFHTIRDAPFPQNPLPAPHRTTGLQIITGNYRLTTTHYRQITGIYMAFTIKDVYRYRRFTDKVGLFTTHYHR